jgi:hypothetical protein
MFNVQTYNPLFVLVRVNSMPYVYIFQIELEVFNFSLYWFFDFYS